MRVEKNMSTNDENNVKSMVLIMTMEQLILIYNDYDYYLHTSQILHFLPCVSFVIRTYGLSPKHVSQTSGNSVSSHFCLLASFLIDVMM
jgi:hypothetical protein